jgi:histidinol-phosphatase (PHP family)
MNTELITNYSARTDRYNFHSHSEFCDGKAPVASIAKAAFDNGFEVWGVTPHSPICIESPCNMLKVDVPRYLETMDKLKMEYEGRMTLLTGMEIDHLSRDFGPHTDYFRKMPLDYRIGSVHFVPNQDGVPLDCDGSFKRFSMYLHRGFADDLRYVVEKYFEQVLTMLELGGFEILGHFDKIIGNAAEADPTLEDQGWYRALVRDVVSLAQSTGVVVEINTKAIEKKGRFFPAERWWHMLKEANVPIVVNSDCHHPDLTDLGRAEALTKLKKLCEELNCCSN